MKMGVEGIIKARELVLYESYLERMGVLWDSETDSQSDSVSEPASESLSDQLGSLSGCSTLASSFGTLSSMSTLCGELRVQSSSSSTICGSDGSMTPPRQPPDTAPPPPPAPLHTVFTDIPPPQMTLSERLVHTHPLWYLTGLSRAGAAHLLHDRKEGSFLVRPSSRRNIMALSIRIGMKPRVEHYLMPCYDKGRIQLEGSAHIFQGIPQLIAYYCQNRDELPIKLALPQIVLQATTQRELHALALLGQDFWTSPINYSRICQQATRVAAVAPYQTGNPQPRTPLPVATNPTTSITIETNEIGSKEIMASLTSAVTPNGNISASRSPTYKERSPEVEAMISTFKPVSGSNTSSPIKSVATVSTVVTMATQSVVKNSPPLNHTSKRTIDLSHVNRQNDFEIEGGDRTLHPISTNKMHGEQSPGSVRSEIQHFISGLADDEPREYSTHSAPRFVSEVHSGVSQWRKNNLRRAMSVERDSYYGSSVAGSDHSTSPHDDMFSRVSYSANTSPTESPQLGRKHMQTASMGHVIRAEGDNTIENPLDTISAAVAMIQKQAESVNKIVISQSIKRRAVRKRRSHHARDQLCRSLNADDTDAACHVASLPFQRISHQERAHNEMNSRKKTSSQDRMATTSSHDQMTTTSSHDRKATTSSHDRKATTSSHDRRRRKDTKVNVRDRVEMHSEDISQEGFPISPPPVVEVKRMQSPEGPKSPPPAIEVKRSGQLLHGVPPSPPRIVSMVANGNCGIPSPLYAEPFDALQGPFPFAMVPGQPALSTSYSGHVMSSSDMNYAAVPREANTIPRLGHDHKETDKSKHRHSDAAIQVKMERRPSAFHPYKEPVIPEAAGNLGDASVTQVTVQVHQEDSAGIPHNSLPVNTSVSPAEAKQEDQISIGDASPPAQPVKRRKSFMDTLPAIFIDNEASDWEGSKQELSKINEDSQETPLLKTTQTQVNQSQSPLRNTVLVSSSAQETSVMSEQVQNQKGSAQPFPLNQGRVSVSSAHTSYSEGTTVEDMIRDMSPDLTVRPIQPLTVTNVHRMSQYDNMSGFMGISKVRAPTSSVGTCYCVPWDSRPWHDLLGSSKPGLGLLAGFTQISCGGTTEEHGHNDNDSDAGLSSVFAGNHDSSPAPSDAKTNLQSELATSFEWTARDMEKLDWRHPGEYDSATDTMPNASSPQAHTPQSGVGGDTLEDKPHPLKLIPPHNSYISDDEGVGNDEEFGTDSFRKRLRPLIACPSPAGNHQNLKGARAASFRLRDFIDQLARDESTIFGATIQHFIKCTIEGHEHNPHIVIRNVRQFMNGIKNYLVASGEKKLTPVIEAERQQLQPDEFMNIDAIIEGALHKCVIQPLNQHLYKLFVQEYKRTGKLQLLSDSIKQARTMTAAELGVQSDFPAPQGASMEVVKHFISRMQRAYSPLKKLENLLSATNALYSSAEGSDYTKVNTNSHLGVDGFVPLLMYVLVEYGLISAEIESDYMWGLLHPCLLSGEGGYCLSTLSSAINLLKNIQAGPLSVKGTLSLKSIPSVCENPESLIKICIPDEKHDLIITKTLPVRPNMTARDICSMIAHKYKITNPQDYGLFILVKGTEDRLQDIACPQTIQSEIMNDGHECIFAFKRNTAKFIWPTTLRR